MSGSDPTVATAGNVAAEAAAEVAPDPIPSIRELLAETDALVHRLHSAQIPHHVGMATACRVLAAELPRALAAQVEADLRSGVLAQRWDAVHAAAAEEGASGGLDVTLTALALLLHEHGRAAARHLVRRERDWAADAYRLEGKADALEAVVHQLQRVADRAPGVDAPDATSEANTDAGVVAELATDTASERAPVRT